MGGPIQSDRLFFSSAYEHFRSRGQQAPQTFTLPNLAGVPAVRRSRAGSRGRCWRPTALLRLAARESWGRVSIAPPVSVNRSLAIERSTSIRRPKDRVTGTFLLSRLGRPDFIWTPYKDFVSPLQQNTWRISGSRAHVLAESCERRSKRRSAMTICTGTARIRKCRRWSPPMA